MKKISTCILLAMATVSLLAGCSFNTGLKPFSSVPTPKSSTFYNTDGSFNQTVAKEAYYDLMRAYHYPIPALLKSDAFWVADFVQADFAKLGMAGIFWKNESGIYGEAGTKAYQGDFKDDHFGYLGHDIFLLPGQVLPEHNHLGNGGNQGLGPKMETWHVRHGSVEFFGEHQGPAGETPISEMPEHERPWGYGESWFKSKYVKQCDAGELYTLNDPESWHFMRAGKNGAIVSEYATYHNDVKFSKPNMEFANTTAKETKKPQK